ncbi:hypothetical protein HELRODRAFT_180548 [Helobdella robusta]|uniref:TANGO6 N-terminal domain-containing protein n=1 Tax=Helobdella robusta TaxID=6412 RepID=T1FG16_HELRO|nr:hypothetical protein HELRODRAFT_180548 [Helobdella robusta]ESN93896.1 hypothetical protein HELRODRAFT_180548 [Helobdella robusta]
MDKITAQSYLEIIGLLTSSSAQNNTDTIKDLFCFNISKVYECLQSNLKYTELLEYINEKFPYLSSSPKLVKKITKEEVVKLFVEWNLFLLEMYSLSLTKEMRIYNRNLKKNVQYLKSPELLSFNEKKSLWYSIDFVFVLGISINMHPGVGLPVTMKSQACQNMQKYFASSSIPFDDSNQIIPEYKDSFELFQKSLNLVMDLFQLKLSPLFKEYIISHHFNTYITALFQISFFKMAPPNKVILVAKSTLPAIPPATTAAVENNENDMTSRTTTTTPFTVDVSRYKEYLDDIIMTSPLKFIFRELILLIGGTPPEVYF